MVLSLQPQITSQCPAGELCDEAVVNRPIGHIAKSVVQGGVMRAKEDLRKVIRRAPAADADAGLAEAGSKDVLAVTGALHPAVHGAGSRVLGILAPREVLSDHPKRLAGRLDPIAHALPGQTLMAQRSPSRQRASVFPGNTGKGPIDLEWQTVVGPTDLVDMPGHILLHGLDRVVAGHGIGARRPWHAGRRAKAQGGERESQQAMESQAQDALSTPAGPTRSRAERLRQDD
jgi:hypothetical protein